MGKNQYYLIANLISGLQTLNKFKKVTLNKKKY